MRASEHGECAPSYGGGLKKSQDHFRRNGDGQARYLVVESGRDVGGASHDEEGRERDTDVALGVLQKHTSYITRAISFSSLYGYAVNLNI